MDNEYSLICNCTLSTWNADSLKRQIEKTCGKSGDFEGKTCRHGLLTVWKHCSFISCQSFIISYLIDLTWFEEMYTQLWNMALRVSISFFTLKFISHILKSLAMILVRYFKYLPRLCVCDILGKNLTRCLPPHLIPKCSVWLHLYLQILPPWSIYIR